MLSREVLHALYDRLYSAYGPQHWWPAETPFEVMVGAVLTQNTSWKNVEQAIANLRRAGLLALETIHGLDRAALAELIRPSGYYNVKAGRLQNLCAWVLAEGGFGELDKRDTFTLRSGLLAVNGIGPETADDILLYAFDRPVFVIDAYTRRLLTRLGLAAGNEAYEELRLGFESRLDPVPAIYNEYHALIVRHAKQRCSGEADCLHCRIETLHN